MANGGWRWHETGIIWISLSNAEIADRPLGDFRASAVRAQEGCIRFAHPFGAAPGSSPGQALRALLRYAPFLQQPCRKHRGQGTSQTFPFQPSVACSL